MVNPGPWDGNTPPDSPQLPGQEPPAQTPPGNDPSADWTASIQAWFRQYVGQDPSPADLNYWLDQARSGKTPIQNIEQAIANSPAAKAYATPSTPATPAPGGPGGAPLTTPFGEPFHEPTPSPYPDAPKFTPPTVDQAANDPGYKFSLDQGQRNLTSWLAAHGTFNDSSAANALQDYGLGAAATQYGNVWNRAYQSWQGALAPWQTETGRVQHDNDIHWQNAFNQWLQDWNIWKDQRDSTFDKRFKVATT